MSSHSDSSPDTRSGTTGRRPGVRPVTWAILAWMLVMIAAIVGAWQGSASRYGAVPEITVSSGRDHVDVAPFTATDLDGTTYTNPVPEITLHGEETIGVRLPVELHRTTLGVYEMREGGAVERTVEAGGPGTLYIPVTTEDEGRLDGLVLRAVPVVYGADGTESILNGEWSVGILHAD